MSKYSKSSPYPSKNDLKLKAFYADGQEYKAIVVAKDAKHAEKLVKREIGSDIDYTDIEKISSEHFNFMTDEKLEKQKKPRIINATFG